MCKWRNVTVEAGDPSNVTGAQQILPETKREFPSEPVSYVRPRTVLKAYKIIKINWLNSFASRVHTTESIACVAWWFWFCEQSNKGPLSTSPEQTAMLRLTSHETSSVDMYVGGSQWDVSFEVIFVFSFDD